MAFNTKNVKQFKRKIRNALSKVKMSSFKLAIVTENGSKQKRKTNMQIL